MANRADLMLSCLRDGKPWTRREIFNEVGYFLTNNAASELRKRGLEVVQWRHEGEYVYQLTDGTLAEGGGGKAPAAVGKQSRSAPPSVSVFVEGYRFEAVDEGGQLRLIGAA